MNYYCCDNCDFLFRRSSVMRECPACESKRIRPATEEEAARLEKLLQQTAEQPTSNGRP